VVYRACREALSEAGKPLLERALAAGELRPMSTLATSRCMSQGVGVDWDA
jgi:hypothetical protein